MSQGASLFRTVDCDVKSAKLHQTTKVCPFLSWAAGRLGCDAYYLAKATPLVAAVNKFNVICQIFTRIKFRRTQGH